MGKVVELGIRVKLDSAGAVPAAQQVAAGVAGIGNQAEQAADKVTAAAAGMKDSLAKVGASVRPLGDQVGGLAAPLRGVRDEIDKNADALNKHTISAKQTAAAMRMVPAQFTDIITSLQGGQAPLTVALQQGGQLRDMFGSTGAAARALSSYVVGLVNPYTVAAGAAAVLGVAYYQGSKEADKFRHSILLSGNTAGTSVDQLTDMARRVGGVVETQGAATEVLAAMVSSGQVAADNLERFTRQALESEKYLGQAATETVDHMAELGEAPLKAAEKLNKQYHFLTVATYDQIRALQDQGRDEEAAAVAQRAYGDALEERANKAAASLGTLESAWMAVKGKAKDAWDAMLDVGRDDTLSEKVAAAEARVQKARAHTFTFIGGGKEGKAALAEAQAALKLLRDQAAAEQWNADQKKESSRLTAAHIKWQQLGVEYLDKETRLTQELAKMRKAGLDAGESDDEIEKRLAQVRKKFETATPAGEDGRKSQLEGRLRAIQAETAAEAGKFAQMDRLNAIYHRGAMLSDGEFYAERLAVLSKANEAELAGFDRQLAALRGFHGKTNAERQENLNQIAQIGAARAKAEQQFKDKREVMAAEEQQRQAAVVRQSDEDASKYVADLTRQAEAQELANAASESSRAVIEREAVARYDVAISYQKQFMAEQLRAGARADEIAQAEIILRQLEAQRAGHERLAAAMAKGDALKFDRQNWKDAEADAKSFAKSLEDAFGNVGGAIGKMSTAMFDFQKEQHDIALTLSREKGQANGNQIKLLEAEGKASQATAKAQVKQYADVSRAAASFFKEGSVGYRTLHGAEQAFRTFEMAMALQSMVTKMTSTTAVTSAVVAGEATKTAAVAAGSTAQVAANMAVGTSAAAAGVANQALGDPYTAWARMAAMAAVMVGLGFAVNGGSGGANVAKERQEAAGTGSVLGDRSAKSESISRSIDLIAANSKIELNHTAGMLASLRSIDSSISGLGSLLGRSLNLDADFSHIQTGKVPLGGTLGMLGLTTAGGVGGAALGASLGIGFGGVGAQVGMLAGPLGAVAGGLIGATVGYIASKLSSVKTSIADQGIGFRPQSLTAASQGVSGYTYADVNVKKSFLGVGYSNKTHQETGTLSAEVSQQFGLVIKQLADSVKSAADILDADGDEFTQRLNQFVVDIGKISLKGMTGEEVQKQLEAIFSKVGDDLAKAGVGGLQEFQKVGEGYLETLSRIANDYATLDALLAATGDEFGAVGLASVAARERVIDLAGGIDSLAEMTQGFAENYLTEAERLAPVTKYVTEQMAALGLSYVTSRDQFKLTALSIDKTTEAGAKQWTAMMALQEAFAKVYPEIEKTNGALKSASAILDERKDLQAQLDKLTMTSLELRAQERESLAESNRALFDQITALQDMAAIQDERKSLQEQMDKLTMSSLELRARERESLNESNRLLFDQLTARQDIAAAYQKEADALKTTIDRLTKFKDNLLSFKDSLALGNLSALTPLQKLSEAQSQYETLLAKARAGDQAAQSQITSAATAYLQANQVIKASSDAYAADAAKVQRDLAELALVAGQQTTESQQQLNALKDQVGQLVTLNTTATGIQEAILNLSVAMNAGQAGSGTAAQSGVVDKLYRDLLQRSPDAAGKAFWMQNVQNGVSYSQMADAFRQSSEYKLLHGSHAGGLERVPFNGYRAELHEDEIVMDAQAAGALRRYFGGSPRAGGGDQLAGAIDRLITQVEGLRADAGRHAGNGIHASARALDDAANAIVRAIEGSGSDAAFERMNRNGATLG